MSARRATVFTTICSNRSSRFGRSWRAPPRYIWNASNSVPIGLYRLQPMTNLFVTELVAVQPPEPLATFLDLNGYLPIGVPMLKRVLALPGQKVCRNGLHDRRRRRSSGRGAGARRARPSASGLEGMPRHR